MKSSTYLRQLLKEKNREAVFAFLEKKDFHQIAKLINEVPEYEKTLFNLLPPETQSEVVLFIDEKLNKKLLPSLSDKEISSFLAFNDEDDATDIVQFLPKNRQKRILNKLTSDTKKKLEHLLQFDSESAGGLMDLNFIIVKPGFTFEDVARKVQRHIERTENVPLVLVSEEKGKNLGYIPYKNLIANPPGTPVFELVTHLPLVPHTVDQEKLVQKVQQMRSEVLGVVDKQDRIIGIIHARDLLKVAQQEATEDVYKFAGVQREEEATDSIAVKIRRRYKWLIINLATAFLASFVVSLFEDTIAQLAILAVFMPMVAGEGGNAATQALAVVVRGLSTGNFNWQQARTIVMREAIAGLGNGIIVGVIGAVVSQFFGGSPVFGVVLGVAMIFNLFIAGLFGALVPFVLKAFKIDPATASSIFVTTATDIFGFLTFLGLGSWLLL